MKQLAADNPIKTIGELWEDRNERLNCSVFDADHLTSLLDAMAGETYLDTDHLISLLATLPGESQQIVLDMLTELFYIEGESDKKAWCDGIYEYIVSKLTEGMLSSVSQRYSLSPESAPISIYFNDECASLPRIRAGRRVEAVEALGRVWVGDFCKTVTVSLFNQEVTKQVPIKMYSQHVIENYLIVAGSNQILAYAAGHWTDPDHVVLEIDDGDWDYRNEEQGNVGSHKLSPCLIKEGGVKREKAEIYPDAVAYKVLARDHAGLIS